MATAQRVDANESLRFVEQTIESIAYQNRGLSANRSIGDSETVVMTAINGRLALESVNACPNTLTPLA